MDRMAPQTPGMTRQLPPDSNNSPLGANRAFVLVPAGGLIGAMAALSVYRPLDRGTFLWLIFGAFFVIVFLLAHIRRKTMGGSDVSSFFPMVYWVAFAPAVLGLALWLNGAMDHSPVESHKETVTRRYITHGRHGPTYYIEFTSWRPKRLAEQMSVSYTQYMQLQVNDPVVVDIHRGALGIPWVGTIHKGDGP